MRKNIGERRKKGHADAECNARRRDALVVFQKFDAVPYVRVHHLVVYDERHHFAVSLMQCHDRGR